MQEIEIKFKVDCLENIVKDLAQKGCSFSAELHQKDTIFVSDLNDVSNEEGKIFTRIRLQNETVFMTLKKQSKKIMQSKEIEFTVGSFEGAYDFLQTLGLKEWVTVEKVRITTIYKGYNICIDSVHRLGDFIEIEIITEEENRTEYYEQQILSLASELGIDQTQRINSYYDTMIHELNQSKIEV